MPFKETKEGQTHYCKACEVISRGGNPNGFIHTCDMTNKQEWEEEFERSFNSKHGRNFHALANDGKRSSECEICIEDNKYNPKGYYLTFLSEQNCYWNRNLMNDVKSYIKKLLSQREAEIRKKTIEAVTEELEKELISACYDFNATTNEDDIKTIFCKYKLLKGIIR